MTSNIWLLLRKLDKHESLFFPIVIEVEEDGPALFGATMPGLETSLIAMGRSTEEAQAGAVSLFQRRVDSALERDRPLGEEFTDRVAFKRLNMDFEKDGQRLIADVLVQIHEAVKEWRVFSMVA